MGYGLLLTNYWLLWLRAYVYRTHPNALHLYLAIHLLITYIIYFDSWYILSDIEIKRKYIIHAVYLVCNCKTLIFELIN